MKREMDLYRRLLLLTEASEPNQRIGARDLDSEEFSDSEVYSHIHLLEDEGLVEILDLSSTDYPNACRIDRLTNRGHDLLAEIRDEGVWETIKEEASDLRGPALQALVQAAIGAV